MDPFVEQQQQGKEDREMNFLHTKQFFYDQIIFLIHFNVHERRESKALNMNQAMKMKAKKRQAEKRKHNHKIVECL